MNKIKDSDWQSQLDDLIKSALLSFSSIPKVSQWAREKELVSWFVTDHLLPQVNPQSIIHQPSQVGIEVAVPQHKTPNNPRKNPDVCKDVVIWEEPKMSCWDSDGMANIYPLSVLEWKSFNKRDRPGQRKNKTKTFTEYDIPWLQKTSSKVEKFIGYGILADVTNQKIEITCVRFTGTEKNDFWFQTKNGPDLDI